MGQRQMHFARKISVISNHSQNQQTHQMLLLVALFFLLIDGCSSIDLEGPIAEHEFSLPPTCSSQD